MFYRLWSRMRRHNYYCLLSGFLFLFYHTPPHTSFKFPPHTFITSTCGFPMLSEVDTKFRSELMGWLVIKYTDRLVYITEHLSTTVFYSLGLVGFSERVKFLYRFSSAWAFLTRSVPRTAWVVFAGNSEANGVPSRDACSVLEHLS